MRINSNIAALNTLNQLGKNEKNTNSSLAKLSSGLRINSAADDAAGLAISEKMKGQIRGLNKASSNSEDGISLIQTAEGALGETESILQRMRELAVQASSDTNTNDDRANIQDEMSQLVDEIDRISSTTQFNTMNLLDGSMSGKETADSANVLTNSKLASTTSATTLATALVDDNNNSLNIEAGDSIKVSWAVDGELNSATINVTSSTTLDDILSGISDATGAVDTTTDPGNMTLTANSDGFAGAVEGVTFEITGSDGTDKSNAASILSSFEETTAAKEEKSTDGRATLQIGANAGQTMKVTIGDMSANALGVKNLDLSSQDGANVAISVVDEATSKVSKQRSYLGAVQNRLEHTINNLDTASENLSSAQSQIADVDMAAEMMEYTKNNVLSQAAQSMLAQANQQPQQVLSLLQ